MWREEQRVRAAAAGQAVNLAERLLGCNATLHCADERRSPPKWCNPAANPLLCSCAVACAQHTCQPKQQAAHKRHAQAAGGCTCAHLRHLPQRHIQQLLEQQLVPPLVHQADARAQAAQQRHQLLRRASRVGRWWVLRASGGRGAPQCRPQPLHLAHQPAGGGSHACEQLLASQAVSACAAWPRSCGSDMEAAMEAARTGHRAWWSRRWPWRPAPPARTAAAAHPPQRLQGRGTGRGREA